MIRMNDGVGHCPFKPTMLSVLGAANARLIDVAGESCARVLGEGLGPECEPTLVTELSFKLGVHALASLVGLPRGTWPEVTLWARDLARCFAPTVEREQVSRGHAAAGKLMGRIRRSPTREVWRQEVAFSPRSTGNLEGRGGGSGMGGRQRGRPLLSSLRRDRRAHWKLNPRARIAAVRSRARRAGRLVESRVRQRGVALEFSGTEHAPVRCSPGHGGGRGDGRRRHDPGRRRRRQPRPRLEPGPGAFRISPDRAAGCSRSAQAHTRARATPSPSGSPRRPSDTSCRSAWT